VTEGQARRSAEALALAMGITSMWCAIAAAISRQSSCRRTTAKSWRPSYHPAASMTEGWGATATWAP
jgi:hypothetical protein